MYTVLVMIVMSAFAGLGVDLGRVQVAKTELERAVDAASRAGVAKLTSTGASAARTQAIAVAGYHTADGQTIVITTSDVVLGKWSSSTKTLNTASASPDAVRVTARVTVTTSFARVIGLSTLNLVTSTTAQQPGGTPVYGIVGLNWFNMNSSTAFTGSYNSATGVFTTGTASNDGSIACNSNMNLNSTASIGGVIYYNTGSAPNGGKDFDAKTKMSSAIATPATPSAGTYATSNSNSLIGQPTSGANYNLSGAQTMPAGNYYFNSLNISNTAVLTCTGAVTLYVNGNCSINGKIVTYQNVPANMKIDLTASSGVNVNATADVYAVINAPTSPLNLSGTHSIIGSVMTTGIDMSGSAGIYYDKALGANGGSGTGTISFVQ